MFACRIGKGKNVGVAAGCGLLQSREAIIVCTNRDLS